ncbi:pimeloyl-ACP methyl ester esterase BioH [Vibrio methylphosphonaticus]|uniref:pimeloyl-ACP methyl ester esterase BioH n=1 Tax=Vibrio methylphosphonaticus TaxID=2946866 RepID=UPI00202AA1B3|nr:pimeloyl-ACP methyl ester esterase BioH [Vibrio methylphosphonaticus]MCL9776444.1 pimeloyl-ACP methyl ester esterase BioH [Vibrio methylphosphonaticus]
MSQDVKVHWQTEGQGPDLVLIHGWGMNGAVWEQCIPKLKDCFTVHVVDLPGYGLSGEVSCQSFSDLIPLVLEDAPSRAIWLGWSLGGLVATQIANQHPDRVTQLVTLASSPKFSQQLPWKGIKQEVLSAFTEQLSKNFTLTIERFMALQAMGSPSARKDVKQLKEAVLSRPMPAPEALHLGLDWLGSLDLRQALREIDIPVHRWYGRLDGLVPVNVADVLDSEMRAHNSYVFTGSSHAPFITELDSFVGKVKSLL